MGLGLYMSPHMSHRGGKRAKPRMPETFLDNKSKVDQRLQKAEKLRKKMAAALKGMMAPAISNPTTPRIIFLKSQKPSLTFCV